MKIFGSFDCKIVAQCQWYSHCLDFSHLLDLHRLNYLRRICNICQLDHENICNFSNSFFEKSKLMDKYGILEQDNTLMIKHKISEHFGNIVMLY